MTTGTLRRAVEADLPQVYDIYYEAEVGDDPHPPPRGDIPSIFRHELQTGEMAVVEQEGRVVAFASVMPRGAFALLAELFVRKAHQSAGIGRALLQHILPHDHRTRCTLSSRDSRALALYTRSGMRPRWPNFWLRADTARLRDLPVSSLEVVEGQGGEPALLRWDTEVSGRYRPVDHAYWVQECQAVPLWFRWQGKTVGYGYAQRRSDDSLWHPEAITLGPIGAHTAPEALACVCAAVEWARPHAAVLRISVPGLHPSLAPLLEAGFRITYVETFFSSAAHALADVECYIPSGSTLL